MEKALSEKGTARVEKQKCEGIKKCSGDMLNNQVSVKPDPKDRKGGSSGQDGGLGKSRFASSQDRTKITTKL